MRRHPLPSPTALVHVVFIVVLVAVGCAGTTAVASVVAAAPAAAQVPGGPVSSTTQPLPALTTEVPGVPTPSADGPAPVGRPEPERRQRLLDTAIWLLLVATVLGIVGGLLFGWWRGRTPPPPSSTGSDVPA